MHVKAKAIAVAGVLAAFTVLMLHFSSMIESSSLFFIAAASFCGGIVIREWGIKIGICFAAATILLNLFLAPNKLHCFTYGGMVIYLLFRELIWVKIAEAKNIKKRKELFLFARYLVFNILYLPTLIFLPSLFLTKDLDGIIIVGVFLAGQVVLYVYDYAYEYFQRAIWGKLRNKL